jgi:plasmid stabilization system protein ParE
LDRIDEALDRIEKAPLAARLRDDDLPVPGPRFANADPAVLIYRTLDNGDSEVVRVAHKSQDFPALFASFRAEQK